MIADVLRSEESKQILVISFHFVVALVVKLFLFFLSLCLFLVFERRFRFVVGSIVSYSYSYSYHICQVVTESTRRCALTLFSLRLADVSFFPFGGVRCAPAFVCCGCLNGCFSVDRGHFKFKGIDTDPFFFLCLSKLDNETTKRHKQWADFRAQVMLFRCVVGGDVSTVVILLIFGSFYRTRNDYLRHSKKRNGKNGTQKRWKENTDPSTTNLSLSPSTNLSLSPRRCRTTTTTSRPPARVSPRIPCCARAICVCVCV